MLTIGRLSGDRPVISCCTQMSYPDACVGDDGCPNSVPAPAVGSRPSNLQPPRLP